MRIGFFTNTYLPNIFGSTTSIETFRHGLEELGHEVYIFTPKFGNYVDENPRVFRYPAFLWRYKIHYPVALSWYPPINAVVKNLKLDLIHAHHPFSVGKDGWRQAQRNQLPIVFTNHTRYEDYTHYVPLFPPSILKKYVIKQATRFANQCQRVIVPTKEIKELIIARGVIMPVEVLPTGIDWHKFQTGQRDFIRKKYAIRKDEICLLWLGRLEQEKNLNFLFEAATKVMQAEPRVKLMLVGEGSERNKLEQMAQQAGLKKRVIFTGLVASEKKQDYYAAADLFIQASLSETQGMTINEAQAAGLPVVAVQATGAIDLIENDKTGILVKNDQEKFVLAIQKLILNPQKRKQLSQQAKAAAKKYDYKEKARELEAIYEKVLSWTPGVHSSC